jgi:polyhydroxyalkanoate synthesis regulator phasin
MLEAIRGVLLAGLGAGVITRERAEQATRRLVEEGKLTAEEAQELIGKLLDSGQRQWRELQDDLARELSSAIDHVDVARRSEVEGLVRRVESLEQRVTMLEGTRK